MARPPIDDFSNHLLSKRKLYYAPGFKLAIEGGEGREPADRELEPLTTFSA
jgi:hypothetical protein